jgi:hypothetical protein
MPNEQDARIGTDGKFWNGDEPSDTNALWGRLGEIRKGKKKPYRVGENKFEHFRPGAPFGYRRG